MPALINLANIHYVCDELVEAQAGLHNVRVNLAQEVGIFLREIFEPLLRLAFAVVRVERGDHLDEKVAVAVADVVTVDGVLLHHLFVGVVGLGDDVEVRAELEVFVHWVVDEPAALGGELHGLVDDAPERDELLGLGVL